MQGKTIGILGLGDIGKSFAKRIFSHECNIIGWDPNAKNLIVTLIYTPGQMVLVGVIF